MDELQKYVSGDDALAKNPDEATIRVVTDHKYGEECGYEIGYELTDMDGKTYPITPRERQNILQALNSEVKVIDLGRTILATHQIKHIKQFKSWFGPRAGGYDG